MNNLFIIDRKVNKLFLTITNNKLWQNMLGHVNYNPMSDMSIRNTVKGMQLKGFNGAEKCKTCVTTKIHTKGFPKESTTRTTDLLEVIHSDICGPFNVKSFGGARYFITFIDDSSRRIFVYFLKAKSEALQMFRVYKHHVVKQTDRNGKILRSDNGREYELIMSDHFFRIAGISR